MKRALLLIASFLLVVVAQVAARGWTPETLPMVHLQDARRYVCNPDGVLSAAAVDSADARLALLERDKGVETVVVVVKHLEGDDPYEFGMALARKYGIGSRQQNSGLIFIIASEDRSYQILTGRGLEGALPDAICRRVENRITVPALKAGDWDLAVTATLAALDGYIRGDASLVNQANADEDGAGPYIGLIIAIGFLVVFALMSHVASKRRNCPRCHKRSLRLVRTEQLTSGGKLWVRRHWKCSKCGHKENTADQAPPGGGGLHRGMWLPPFIFGPGAGGRGGGGFGRGGFGGGSFGGGSFDGGGSGGRF